jgi:hypothetical protein
LGAKTAYLLAKEALVRKAPRCAGRIGITALDVSSLAGAARSAQHVAADRSLVSRLCQRLADKQTGQKQQR